MPTSFLHSITEKVNQEPDLEKAKAILLEYLGTLRQSPDVRKMKVAIQYQIFTREKLTMFVYNNILKYEGLGVL